LCGIGGILRTDGQPIPEEWLDAIDARIAYRGPDGHGRFRDRVEIDDPTAPGGKRVVEVAFVHRRLSIIDHKDGAQPMVSERGRKDSEGLVAVVFNGCIYNHRELRKELESKGHRFVTDHSDTEVLIHGWREWNEQLTSHLEGMFAFAIWDRGKTQLFLARDAFGEKPLYWQRRFDDVESAGARWAFASEASCIGMSPIGDLTEPSWRISEYLDVGYAWNGETFFCSPAIWNMEPDSYEAIGVAGEQSPYANIPDGSVNASLTAENLAQLLERAVQRRLVADVPLGCFLSGGVDSSLIAHFAKKHKPDLHTYTVRMPDHRYDESKHAETASRVIGTQHHTLDVVANPAVDLVHLINLLRQPFADSSILPTYWVSKAARQHVKVAIAGDGGDELFCGYERYVAARTLARHWRIISRLPRFLLNRTHPKSLLHKLGRFGEMARNYRKVGIYAMESVFTMEEISQLTGASEWLDEDEFPSDALAWLRQFDVRQYLPNDLLTKVDTASMACGLEVRCPFLDRDLARAALTAPIEQLMPGGQRKGLLRQIARKYLPKEIVDRPKMGFAIPIGEWFRNDDLPHKGSGMRTLLLDHLNSAEPFGPIQLNRKAVQRFIDEHMSGKRDHGQRLFTLLTLSIWARSLKETQNSAKTQTHK
jgi:asparagine synthase (glutamine-hydrolysing)